MKRLAIVTSHPIQYNAPWFKLLSERKTIAIKVFYTWGESVLQKKFDPGFGKDVNWDIPLLEGYNYTFVKNDAVQPGTHHFKGLINPTLNKEIEEWKADAVLIFGWSFVSHLKCIRHFKNKIPVIFRGDSTLIDEVKGFKTIVRRFFLKWVYRNIDYALYVGTNNKKYFLKHGVKDSQLIYASHAIDNERFAQPNDQYEKEAKEWREKLGIAETDIVFLFAGKFEQKKNPFFLLQLADRMKETHFKFILVGNGVLEPILKEQAKKDSRIKFIDFINQLQMPSIYRIADIFILPSRGPGETWGLALNEAMACGRPVISTLKVGGAIDLIEENKNGFIIDPDNVNDVQEKVNAFIQKPNELKAIGLNAKKHIQNFSFENIAVVIEKLLSKLN